MIFVTGSLAFDFIMDYPGRFADQIVLEKIHQINLSFLVNTLREGRGGTAGNISYNLALLKQKVAVVASAGKDFTSYRKFLLNNGVKTDYIHIVKNDFTARAFITTDIVDNQLTGFYPGALRFDAKLSLPLGVTAIDFVVIAPTDPLAMAHFTSACVKKKIPFLFDPGMQLPRISDEDLLKGVEEADIVIGNDYEIALMEKRLKKDMYVTLHDRVSQYTTNFSGGKIFVKTLGAKGSEINVVNGKKKEIIIIPPAKPKEVLDPTGAGDAYRAGFLAGFIRGFPLPVCGKMGGLAAVYTVEKYGTTTHEFTIKEFCKRYKENFNESLKI